MNRLSEYIKGMTLTRQHLMEARIAAEKYTDPNSQRRAVANLICAFDAFVSATNNAISIREKVKVKK